MYARFLAKRQKVWLLYRIRYYSKLALYSIPAMVIIAVTLFSYQHTWQPEILLSNESVDITSPSDQRVYADIVGKIISLVGQATILRGDNEIKLQEIYADSIITLKKWSTLDFTIEWNLQMQLIGPARFVLRRSQEWSSYTYALELIEWSIINVQSQKNTSAITPATSSSLTIKTKYTEISSIKSNKDIQLKVDTHGQTLIANQWKDSINIKTYNEEDQTTQIAQILSDQVVVINDEWKLVHDLSLLAQNNLIGNVDILFGNLLDTTQSDTYNTWSIALSSETWSGAMIISGAIDDDTILPSEAAPTIVQNDNPVIISSNSDTTIDTTLSDTPIVSDDTTAHLMSSDQFFALQKYIDSTFIDHVQSIIAIYAKADYQAFLSHHQYIQSSIFGLYESFQLTPHIRAISQDPQIATSQYLALLSKFQTKIQLQYSINPRQLQNLSQAQSLIVIARSVGYGKFIHSELNNAELLELIITEVHNAISNSIEDTNISSEQTTSAREHIESSDDQKNTLQPDTISL